VLKARERRLACFHACIGWQAFGLYFKLLGEAAFVRRLRTIVLRSENEHIFHSSHLTDFVCVTVPCDL